MNDSPALDAAPTATRDTDARARALAGAAIPTLLMSLVQITGDRRWLQEPYRPKRDVSLFAEESGGLSDEAQQAVRDAMAQVLDELADGTRQLPPLPDDATFLEMMRTCLGEMIPPEYVPMALEEMGMRDRAVKWQRPPPDARVKALEVLVIGAGVSGLAAAVRLKEMGIPFTVLEKNQEVGGTWAENDYPGSGVDTPNHFYSYSFAPNLRWTSNYSKRAEVWDYLRGVAHDLQLRDAIRFGIEVTRMQWHEDRQQWEVHARAADGTQSVRWARVVVTAVGQLNRPKAAGFPGMETFPGESWHSARWRHDVPLEGKNVAIVGTGASAMQFLPAVAQVAAQVTIFQRSPQWARPQPDYHKSVSDGNIWLMENVPYYYPWYRFGLLWRFGDGLLPSIRRDPDWPHPERAMNHRNDRHRQQLTDYLLQELEGREDLIEKTLPDYPPYGKRILIDNGWYQALKRPNVELVTERVDHVEGGDVVTPTGARYAADVILLATGFEVARLLGPMDIRGRSGVPLREVWGEDNPSAYLGITVPDYPNLFCLFGPNTGLAHGGSLMFMAECQVRYLTGCLREMIEQDIGALEVRQDVHDEYCARVDAEHAELVWTHPGMNNWYRNAQGRVFSPVPWRLVDYWQMTREADLSKYHAAPCADIS